MKKILVLLLLSGFFLPAGLAEAQIAHEELFAMSLEELLNIEVSTVSRKAEEVFKTPSAVTVITSEDIRRSGATSIPQLLRMVPGMNIGQLNGNSWAVSARGRNDRFTPYLLVMVDGRSVFNPLFNGVYWSRIDTLLEDVDRVEVIRGPGASLWGANATNGIVNIITKPASETVGAKIVVTGGSHQFNNEQAVRLGYGVDNGHFRFYGKKNRLMAALHPMADEQSNRNIVLPEGETANDFARKKQVGFRSDWSIGKNGELTVQGDFYEGEEGITKISDFGSTTDLTVDVAGGNFLARYDHEFSLSSDCSLQAYYDNTSQNDTVFLDERQIFDFDFQHRFSTPIQEIVWGTGYRYVDNHTQHWGNIYVLAMDPANRQDEVFSFFLQDSINVIEDRLTLNVGVKYEQNDYTGSEWQPSTKIAYTPNDNHTLWASIARAVSIPSRIEADGYLDLSGADAFCSMMGGTMDPELGCIINIATEQDNAVTIVVSEAGYRVRFSDTLTLDNAVFYNDYITNNQSDIDYVWGYEGSLFYQPWDKVRLELAYIYQNGNLDPDYDFNPSLPNANVPNNSIKFKSYYNITDKFEFDMAYTYMDQTHNSKSFSTLDIRLAYQVVEGLECSVTGINLIEEHTEPITDSQRINTLRERAVIGKLTFTH